MTSTWPERRALTVSLIGLCFQVLLGVFLGVVGLWNGSQADWAATWLAACGTPIWLILVLVYKQRVLVREEQLETEQLRQERSASGAGAALFAGDEERLLTARRRLSWLYRWMLPIFTIAVIGALVTAALWRWSWPLGISLRDPAWVEPTNVTTSFGFVLGAAFLAFLLSRYATGLARQPEWRLLRTGAAYLMGCTLACVAAGATIGLVHFRLLLPERVAAYGIRILMLVLAVEFLLNFVLDFYRPRRAGEEPRPAFDSRLLGLFCEPGGIARSIAEALNYQFGFEVSSTWFYKLMQRAITPVIFFGVVTMFAASSLVIVNAGEVAIIERYGEPLQTGEREANPVEGQPRFAALGPGLHFKWPWPIDRVHRYPADQVINVVVGIREGEPTERERREPLLWTKKHDWAPHINVLVAQKEVGRSPSTGSGRATTRPAASVGSGRAPSTQPSSSSRAVLVNMLRLSLPIHYRIKDLVAWRTNFVDPAAAFENLAFRETVKYAAGVDVDQVLGADRMRMARDLKRLIQAEADRLGLGIEVVMLGMQSVHPPEEVAEDFEAVVGAESKKRTAIRSAEAERNKILSEMAGDVQRAEALAEAIQAFNAVENAFERGQASEAQVEAARARVDELFEGNPAEGLTPITGKAAETVAAARADMWTRINQARADAETFELEYPVYRAAPNIYRNRKYLEVLRESFEGVRKYLFCADINPIYQLDLLDPTVSRIEEGLRGTEAGP